jgi:hypothetical protein
MKPNHIVFIALGLVIATWLGYWINFGHTGLSGKNDDWAQFGDFVGGTLNPILTFLTIVILIHSLKIQKDDSEKTKKFEKTRSFESHFFNMIETQNSLFNDLKINFGSAAAPIVKTAGAAALQIEEVVVHLKESGQNTSTIKHAIETVDSENAIYTSIRTFAVVVNLIERKLTDEEGFTAQERLDYYEIFINYTDYSLFKLILISIKYLNNAQVLRIEANKEFIECIEFVGAGDYLRDI